jgi:F-type H+-transporting ATPase subunit b
MITPLIAYAAEATHATQEVATASGIGALGIDLRALIFQIINFLVLLLILRVVAYKPILKMLEARRQAIETSLKQAEQIEATKREIEREQQRIVQEAYTKAHSIMTESQKQAEAMVKVAQEKAAAQGEIILQGARARIDEEIRTAKRDLKKETLSLVALATEQVLGEKIDQAKDEALIKKALEKVGEKV